jgi:hypothetical protein
MFRVRNIDLAPPAATKLICNVEQGNLVDHFWIKTVNVEGKVSFILGTVGELQQFSKNRKRRLLSSARGLFKDAMRRLAAGVSLVTSGMREHGYAGLIATSVVSVSMDPPTLLVCVNQSSSTHPVIEASGPFCANLLSSQDRGLVDIFGRSDRRGERFRVGEFEPSPLGPPPQDVAGLHRMQGRGSVRVRHAYPVSPGTLQRNGSAGSHEPNVPRAVGAGRTVKLRPAAMRVGAAAKNTGIQLQAGSKTAVDHSFRTING